MSSGQPEGIVTGASVTPMAMILSLKGVPSTKVQWNSPHWGPVGAAQVLGSPSDEDTNMLLGNNKRDTKALLVLNW